MAASLTTTSTSQPNDTWRMQSLYRLLRLVLAAIEEVAGKEEINYSPSIDRGPFEQHFAPETQPAALKLCEDAPATLQELGVLAELIKKLPAPIWFCDVGEA